MSSTIDADNRIPPPPTLPLTTHFAVEARRGESLGDVIVATCQAGKGVKPWFRRLEWMTSIPIQGRIFHRFRSDVSEEGARALMQALLAGGRAVICREEGQIQMRWATGSRPLPNSILFTYERKSQWALFKGPRVKGWEETKVLPAP
jgi:hypothetical protein